MTVENELRKPFSYIVKLNASYDGNPLAKEEVIPKEIRAKGNAPIGPMTQEDVVSLLWLDHFIPEWIDVVPWEARPTGLTFELLCCGRFTKDSRCLYHKKEGYPPFHAPGVMVPPDWKSVEEDGRFDLNWHLSGRCDSQ